MSHIDTWRNFVLELRPGVEDSAQLIRSFLSQHPRLFLAFAANFLADAPASSTKSLFTHYLLQAGVVELLCRPDLLTFSSARRLCLAIVEQERDFDIRLARYLADRSSQTAGRAERVVSLRALALLNEIARNDRLLPILMQLLRSSDPFIRSKTALLIGSLLNNPAWFERQMQDPDARTRANAIEALWGSRWGAARSFCEQALSDSHPRVVANALIGLYLAGEQDRAKDLLGKMRVDSRPNWQASAAFAFRHLGLEPGVETQKREAQLGITQPGLGCADGASDGPLQVPAT